MTMNPQRIVIFDSPDGTGKTEMAKELTNYSFIVNNAPYFRMGSQHRNFVEGRFKTALEFDQTYIAEFLRQTGHSVVIDRAYPSEWVYSKAFDRETNEEVLNAVDEQFAQMGAVIVIPLRRDYSKNREDEVVKKEMLQDIADLYEDFIDWTSCRTISIYVDDFENDLKKEIPPLISALKQHWTNWEFDRRSVDQHLLVHVEDGVTKIEAI